VLTRPLGRSGFEVSALGAGTGGLDASRWRDLDPAQGARTLREALDAGVTFIATGPSPERRVEALVGEAVRELRARDRTVVATQVPAAGQGELRDLFPEAHVQRAVEDSLRAQRAEVLPVAQLGRWSDRWLEQDEWDALRQLMARLIREGKVLSWGVVAGDSKAAEGVLEDPAISSLQVRLHLLDRGALPLTARAAERQVGVIACAPLDGGLLGGPLVPGAELPAGDARVAQLASLDWPRVGPRLDRLRELARRETGSLPELALRWSLTRPGVATVVCGMRRRDHLRDNLAAAAAGRPLGAELEAALDELAADSKP
jgi:aryl-alcohol dehydrogenase-like predicted oxidoreductase